MWARVHLLPGSVWTPPPTSVVMPRFTGLCLFERQLRARKDAAAVKHWGRLGRNVWRYRRQVLLSVIFGLGAAVLWSAELLLTFPVVTVFVEGKTLEEYVRDESAAAQARLDDAQSQRDDVDRQLSAFDPVPRRDADPEQVALLKERSRLQAKIDRESWKIWSLGWTATRILAYLPSDEFPLLIALFGFLVLVTAAKGVCVYIQDLTAGSVAELTVVDLRAEGFRHLLRRDPQSVEWDGAPRLLAGLTYDLQGLVHTLTTLGGRVVREPLKAVTCLTAAFWLNWQLTSLSLILIPVAVWLFQGIGRRMKRAVHRVLDTMARVYKFLEQSFTNLRVVHAFGMQGSLRRDFHRQNRQFYEQSMKIVKIDALTNPITEVLGIVAILVTLLPGSYLLLRGTETIWGIRMAHDPISLQELTTLYALLAGVIDPLRKFSKYFTLIKQAGSSLERVFAQMDRPTLVPQSPNAIWLPPLASSIEFRDVHFHYRAGDVSAADRQAVLNGLTLTVQAGETIALVGPNGSGKSTCLGLLPRFYDPTAGAVLWDGIDLRDARLRDLRRQTAIVPQESLLFDDTLWSNIRYGNPDATEAEILRAAKAAHVDEFAERLPDGWQTIVGEGGRALSGGQRQRVALARAILRDPAVLLLDEPTAAVDAQSERWIHESLAEFTRNRTTFLITHHLGQALLQLVDRIAVFDRGRIVGLGTHRELLETCPIYRQLQGGERQAA